MRVWVMVTTMALVVAAVVIVACGGDGRVALPVATATPGPSPTAVVTPTPRPSTSQPAPTPIPLEALFEQAKASVQERGYDLTDYTFTVDQQDRRVLALSSRCHFPPGLDISMLANPGFPCSTTHFFLEDQYLGTDTFYTYLGTGSLMPSDPGQFRIGYTTYAPGDPRCCPSVWDAVIYTWDGQKLNASGEPPRPFGKPFSETGTPTHLEGWRGWAKANGWNVQQPAPPPAEEPPPPTLEAILPVQLPQSAYADECQAWVGAGGPADDLYGLAACTLFATEVCTAWLADPSVAGGSEACELVEMLSGYSQPSYSAPTPVPTTPTISQVISDLPQCIRWLAGFSSLEISGKSACRSAAYEADDADNWDLGTCIRWLAGFSSLEITGKSACRSAAWDTDDWDLEGCIRWLAGLSSLEITGRAACREVASY